MTGELLTLFCLGLAAGGCSVVFHFLTRSFSGAYPDRLIRFPDAKRHRKRKRRSRPILTFLLDFALTLFFGAYLVLFDATVLGGLGRLFHLAVFLFGLILVRRLFLTVLYSPTERVIRFCFELVGCALACLLLPVRKCFSLFLSILSSLHLILKRINDKMKKKRRAKRELAHLYLQMETAFLPSEFIGALGFGRETNGR